MNAQETNISVRNKARVQTGFDRWAKGIGNFFDLLAEDMHWTVSGHSRFSKTYIGKQQFMDELIAPLSARLAIPIVPRVRGIYTEDDMVVVLWDGTATTLDGRPYNNSYAWFIRLKNDRIIEVVAFFDTSELLDLWNRVPVPPGREIQ